VTTKAEVRQGSECSEQDCGGRQEELQPASRNATCADEADPEENANREKSGTAPWNPVFLDSRSPPIGDAEPFLVVAATLALEPICSIQCSRRWRYRAGIPVRQT
jgi:hypothetical protein